MSQFAALLALNALDQTTLNFGVTVTYAPGGANPVNIPAIIEQTRFEIADREPVWAAHDDLTLLIRVSDYAAEPASADRVTLNGSTYQVAVIEGRYLWEWADVHQLRRRVRMKRITS